MKKNCCTECFEIFNESFSHYEIKNAVSEKNQSFKIESTYKSVCCIKVDGGLIHRNSTQRKCDFLFVIDENNTKKYLFVELKGGSVSGEEAVKQLVSTIDYFRTKYGVPSKSDTVLGFVIGGSVTVGMAKWRKIIMKTYGGELIHISGHKQSCEFK